MGLPIWRDPEEKVVKKDAIKPDPTAAARSPIRRRPSVHGRRSNRARSHIYNESSRPPPRFSRSPPPSVGFNGFREGRRRTNDLRVPPISTLLESADRRSTTQAPSPPTTDMSSLETRSVERQTLDARDRELRSSLAELQGRAAQLDREARAIEAGLRQSIPPDFADWPDEERRTWIQNNLRRSTSPGSPAQQNSAGNTLAVPAQYAPLSRSPEPILRSSRPHSRDGTAPRRSALPTPPHDVSEDTESLFMPAVHQMRGTTSRPTHPLSRSWRPESPVNGLGDRNRSPTPADGWEVMRTTITPDATLPSADSSFTSAAASHSFTSNDTNITQPEPASSSDNGRRSSAEGIHSDSVSSVDPDDLACPEDELAAQAAFAEDVYFHERDYPEGRERIEREEEAQSLEGNRYALGAETPWAEIGFRLIEEALMHEEGRERVFQISRNRPTNSRNLEEWIFASRRENRRTTRGAPLVMAGEPPSPHPERYDEATRAAVRETRNQVHDYFRRFAADALTDARDRVTSPPPRYEPLASHPDVNTFSSREGPEPLPVSSPSARSEREVGDALLGGVRSGDEQDLGNMRRIVERLAQREDVPDEWWISMGLRSPAIQSPRSPGVAGRTGRPNSRL